MNGICGDNRFEIINKVKKRLLEATNIEQSPKELEVLDNLLFRLWQCGYFDYIETFEKEEMTFKEWYKKSDCELTGVSIGIARCIFQAGAKAMQEDKQSLAKRIYELQSDLSREKSKNEKTIEELEELQRENEQLKEYNTDLKQSLDWANERETEWSNRIEELKTDLEYAKAIIIDLLNNSHEYTRQNAEQFIKGEKK